jgi:hypothetical protein
MIQRLIAKVMEVLHFNSILKNYFKSVTAVVIFFVVNASNQELEKNKEYQHCLIDVSVLLNVSKDDLNFIIQLISGNPYRIFACAESNPEITIDKFEIRGEIGKSNFSILSKILRCSMIEVKRFSAMWIYNYKIAITGQKYIYKLAQDIL